MSSVSSFRRLLPFAIVVFLAYVGFSLPLPLFPELFLDSVHGILPASYSLQTKVVILGIIMASFPLGQFIGAPILGKLSDMWGRKRVILVSLCGSTLGYACTGFAVHAGSVVGIFACLMISGFCEGNIAIAQAVIADIEDGPRRTTHFGWLNMFVSFGFIVGPLLGGQLVQPRLSGGLSFAMPFYAAAFMTVLGIGVIYFFAHETWAGNREKIARLSLWQVWRHPPLKRLYIVNFFLWCGLFFYWRYLPVFLEQIFDFRVAEQSYVLIYDSLIIMLAIPLLVERLAKKVSAPKATAWGGLFLALSFVVVVLPTIPEALILTIPPIGVALAVVMTNSSVMVSNTASASMQGQAMGSLAAMQVLAEVFTTVGGGFLAGQLPALPLFVGAALIVCGCLYLFFMMQKNQLRAG